MHTRPLLTAVLIGLVTTAGCTSTSAGDPSPAPSTARTTAPGTAEPPAEEPPANLPAEGAPRVEHPLDTTRYQQDPCQALTGEQATEFAVVDQGTVREGELGLICEWRSPRDELGKLSISSLDGNRDGLTAAYRAHQAGKYELFEELPEIEGHPAVVYGQTNDRETGNCAVLVGTTDELAFEFAVQLSLANVGSVDPCDMAVQVAGVALRNMKGDR